MICTTYFLTFFSELIPPTGNNTYCVTVFLCLKSMKQFNICKHFFYVLRHGIDAFLIGNNLLVFR